MSRAAFFALFLLGFTARAEDALHASDYAVKLGVTFFETAEQANALSADGGYAQAAQVWTEMIAAEQPAVPAQWRPELFQRAKDAQAELQHRAQWDAAGNAPALRSLFRSVTRGMPMVEHAEVGDRRLAILVQRLLAYDADTGRILGAPFQVLVEVKDYSEEERKTLLGETMQALRKAGLKAESKPPVKDVRRVLKLTAKPGKTTPPPAKLEHAAKLPASTKSCGIDLAAELTEDDKVLLKTDLSARSLFGLDDQCRVGPLRIAAQAAPIRLIEAAMPSPTGEGGRRPGEGR